MTFYILCLAAPARRRQVEATAEIRRAAGYGRQE